MEESEGISAFQQKQFECLLKPHLTNPETMTTSVSFLEHKNTLWLGLLNIYVYFFPYPEFFLFYLNPKQKSA
jgi:hypothetical protein